MLCPACGEQQEVVFMFREGGGHHCEKAGVWVYNNGVIVSDYPIYGNVRIRRCNKRKDRRQRFHKPNQPA